jgi:hypothetical protein
MNAVGNNTIQPVAANVYVKAVNGKSWQVRKTLEKVAKAWEKSAQDKVASYTKSGESDKATIAADALSRAKAIQKKLKNKKLNFFAAYDKNTKSIKGIAVANFNGKNYKAELDELLVNPENIQSIGLKPMKGIGKAIVQRVAKEVLAKKGYELGTYSLPSAVPFYEKLGFSDLGGGANSALSEMYLDKKGLQKLAKAGIV